MRERFGARDERSLALRFHAQTGGSTLTAQGPLTNVVRVALQAFAATAGGCQSLHTNGYDEALALPTERSATLALRTQQVLLHESGVAAVPDPFGGSEYVEALTDELEREARALIAEIDERGGAVAAIESGWVKGRIEDQAFAQQRAIERGESVIVGVNRYPDPPDSDIELQVVTHASEQRQIERLRDACAARATRPPATRALAAVARGGARRRRRRCSSRCGTRSPRAARSARCAARLRARVGRPTTRRSRTAAEAFRYARSASSSSSSAEQLAVGGEALGR